MTHIPGWGASPPHSPQPPPSSSDGPLPHVNGNAYLMLGELIGNVRHILWRQTAQDGQIAAIRQDVETIKGDLRQGSTVFKAHHERLRQLERAPRWEKLTKRWAAFLAPFITMLAAWWLTGSIDLAMKFAGVFK